MLFVKVANFELQSIPQLDKEMEIFKKLKQKVEELKPEKDVSKGDK